MSQKWGYIGGGSALLLAGLVVSHYGRDLLPEAETAPASPAVTAAPPPATPPAEAVQAKPVQDETARLLEALAARETENKRLQTALTVGETVLKSLQVSADARQAALDEAMADLGASLAEIRALRAEVEALRAPSSFDAALLAFKADADPSAARLEAARVEKADVGAMFAAAEAPPPASVRMALHPAALALAAAPAPMVEVQFDFASALLTPGGEAYASAAAKTLSGMDLARIRIVGHTDRVGTPAANRRLAAERAHAVADFLVAAGLPADLIETAGMGETDAPVATEDGIAEPLNRSVAIIPVPTT